MAEIDQYERIQAYLRDRMSDEERSAFESDLASDYSLRRQYEELALLARSVKKANQASDLKIALQKMENQLVDAPESIMSDKELEDELSEVEKELTEMGVIKPRVSQVLKDRVKGVFRAIGQWFIPTGNMSLGPASGNTVTFSLSYASRMAISFAVAASLALTIILPYNANMAASGYNYAPSRLELQTYRGSSSNMLEKANNSYNNGDYGLAFSYLNEAKNGIESTLAQLGDSDSDIIAKQDLNNQLYQIEWCRALALMKDKKVKDAKRALRAISVSNSPFANEAHDILDNVY